MMAKRLPLDTGMRMVLGRLNTTTNTLRSISIPAHSGITISMGLSVKLETIMKSSSGFLGKSVWCLTKKKDRL